MANYSLVVNSQFQPFTYQELAAPLDRQELYHEKIADEYDKLSSQADVLEAMGANDRDKNSKTYLKYKNYSDNLRKEADNLYQNGLNYDTRQRLSNLRRMYNTDIVPIQNAWNKREQEADMQMKASMQNPSLMFTRDARNSTLDEYIANPTGGFGVINGNNITAQMASMAKNLEKQIREGSARKEDIDPFTYNYIQENGLKPDIIRNWRTNPTLSKMFEQVMRANGVTPEALNGSANAQSIIDQSTGYAEMGMWNAIGADQSQIINDFKSRADYQFALNERAAENAAARAAEGAIDGGFNGTLTDSPYQLPMNGADNSQARDQEKAMQTLGYTLGKDGKLSNTGKVKISYSENGTENASFNMGNYKMGDYPTKSAKNVTKEVSVYNKDGKVMTRSQFVKQAGSNPNAIKAFNDYFDKMVSAGKTLGIYGTQYTSNELAHHYNTLRDKNAAQFANVRALNYNKGDWNPNSLNYPVREIKSYKEGKPVFDTKATTLEGVLNKKDSDKNNISVASYWSDTPGNEGLILATTEDGKPHRYFIDADNMPEGNIQSARKYFDYARMYKERGRSAEAKQALELAYRALHTGLTIHNSGYDQSMVRQPTLQQAGLIGK